MTKMIEPDRPEASTNEFPDGKFAYGGIHAPEEAKRNVYGPSSISAQNHFPIFSSRQLGNSTSIYQKHCKDHPH
jgi:hypothetical protein